MELMIEIYNTLTQEKESFEPINEDEVTMYVCGPTVYNYIHIGNARSAVAFDVVRRYLEYRGYNVNYVSNFTDVDDKIIKAADENDVTTEEIAERYILAYFEDTEALNVKEATHHPRVIEHIPDIIEFIEEIIDNGYAYEVEGDVYFDTRKFKDYGKLSKISMDDLREGASERTTEEERRKKKDPVDFVLWKKTSEEELHWDSPWSKGRPGWHIECSVMSTKHLGDTFDIHGGGHDLTFPHHENEIAQSEAKTGQTFANYWMHNGFVNMEDEKMSKSLGNVVLVHDLIEEIDPQVVRFFLATTHYRQPINYTEETLKEAATSLERVQTAYKNLEYRLVDAEEELGEDDQVLSNWIELEKEFVEKMDDDFNAANGITVVYEMVKFLNRYSKQNQVSEKVIDRVLGSYIDITGVFGIEVAIEEELLDQDIEDLIEERVRARAEGNYERADQIRDELNEQGIILEDTAQGMRWRREKS